MADEVGERLVRERATVEDPGCGAHDRGDDATAQATTRRRIRGSGNREMHQSSPPDGGVGAVVEVYERPADDDALGPDRPPRSGETPRQPASPGATDGNGELGVRGVHTREMRPAAKRDAVLATFFSACPHVPAKGGPVKGARCGYPAAQTEAMVGIAVLLVIIGIVLLLLGVFVEAVKFLLWIGLIILVIGIIAALMRFIRRQS